MNIFKLAICLSDEALAGALARAIAKEYAYVHVYLGEWDEADYTMRDGFLTAPEPVESILERVFSVSGKAFSFPRRPDSCPFTAFTAGGGGRGVSTCAKLYAAFAAQEGRRRILYLSFDPYLAETDPQAGMALLHKVLEGDPMPLKAACRLQDGYYSPVQAAVRNLFCELDLETTAAFLQTAEDSGEWDEVVLDIPRAHSDWQSLLSMCETCIVVCPAAGEEQAADLAVREELSMLQAVENGRKTDLIRFPVSRTFLWEEGGADRYGPLGCEVRELAQQLAMR